MRQRTKILITSLMLAAVTVSNSLACTSVFYNDSSKSDLKIVARNEDYVSPVDPTLVVTPRGIKRDVSQEANGAKWTGKYGSVVMYANNQFPMDGINEKGLTARTLFFAQGVQENLEGRDNNQPTLDSDYWVSYVLDNFATVDQAVKALKNDVTMKNIKRDYEYASSKHLTIADVSGDSAVIEIQDGELKIFHGPEYKVLTNPGKYQDMLKAYDKYKDADVSDIPGSLESEDRFVRAHYYLDHLASTNDRYEAYGYLNQVLGSVVMPVGTPLPKEDEDIIAQITPLVRHPEKMKGNGTYWSSISDLTNLEYRFKSAKSPSDVYIDLKDIDFNNSKGVRVVPMLDEHAQKGIFGNIKDQLVRIDGDIYDQEAN